MTNQKGVALIIMLWMMVVVSTLVLSFSAATRTETLAVMSFKSETGNRFLAEAGVQRGIMEIYYRLANKRGNPGFDDQGVFRTDGTAYQDDLGKGHYTIRIADESGKININLLTDSSGIVLNNLLVNLGVESENADVIVDSLLDWKDKDDLTRLNGAENEYYLSLPTPYGAKNDVFDTPEELLLVRGMSADILYGTGERPGLINFITIHSGSDKINLNAAPREVLAAIPGIADDGVENIIALRQPGIQDLQAALGAGYATAAPFVTVGDSNTFTIDSTGYGESESKGYSIRTTITVKGQNAYQTVYYKSPFFVKR